MKQQPLQTGDRWIDKIDPRMVLTIGEDMSNGFFRVHLINGSYSYMNAERVNRNYTKETK